MSALHDAAKRLTSDDYPVGLVIRNGKLISATASGVVLDDLFGDVFLSLKSEVERFCADGRSSDYVKACVKDWYEDELGVLQRMKRNVPRTGHRLEQLDVSAERVAVAIKGSGNVVRQNQLKVTGCGVNIYLIGGNQVIEGNTIVVSGARCSPADAPIRLHVGDNSVIRNNTIIIEGWGDRPDAAISVIDSQNVLIENNKVVGAKTLYKIWDEDSGQKSSVTERGNEMKSSWLGWK
ncbi:MAG: right-handed parallel beta-helix repeat-containing protein [Aquabacterium sp.]|uniref:right-handed parallel beta-helix repeat-containing protein n=1 Tax=Aquabacterium sp. TaxID=1872578 RepID=UPI0025BE5472|nr:right-handed parallel beta-helix repeat-containing protein [Aquabacterium sp.]MBI5926300.1 right-handed parallel beta-helix repeat-containing protein [Aquabacterium sp.]